MLLSNNFKSTKPLVSTGKYVTSNPSSCKTRHESKTHLCSVCVVILSRRTDRNFVTSVRHSIDSIRKLAAHMCFFLPLKNRAIPLIDMLLDSVAPEVKTISFGFAPIRSATCCFWWGRIKKVREVSGVSETALGFHRRLMRVVAIQSLYPPTSSASKARRSDSDRPPPNKADGTSTQPRARPIQGKSHNKKRELTFLPSSTAISVSHP